MAPATLCNKAFGHSDHHSTTRDTNPSISTSYQPNSTSTMTNGDKYLISKHHLTFPAITDDGLPVLPHHEHATHLAYRATAKVQPLLPPSPGNITSSSAIARAQFPNNTGTRDELAHIGAAEVKNSQSHQLMYANTLQSPYIPHTSMYNQWYNYGYDQGTTIRTRPNNSWHMTYSLSPRWKA